ncbi:hypothetical protein [Lysobacter gummosus]|uniref:hypothetical protein n=1 Tax=Lysobacter gummosus TaxID=262324 RepID=UPI003626BA95
MEIIRINEAPLTAAAAERDRRYLGAIRVEVRAIAFAGTEPRRRRLPQRTALDSSRRRLGSPCRTKPARHCPRRG